MRVLVIPSWYPPNGGWFFKEHAMALAIAGAKVDVMAGVYSSLRRTNPLKWVMNEKAQVRKDDNIREFIKLHPIIPFSAKMNYHAWVRMMLLFYDKYFQQWGHPDIIQVHSSLWAGVVASHINKKYKIPYVITEHRSRFVYNTEEARSMFQPWHTSPLNEAFKSSKAIITVSNSLQKKIIDLYPPASEKLDIIFNMVDTDFFSPATFNKPENKKFELFCLANLEYAKGVDILLEAFKIISSKLPGLFELTIGGDGPEKKALKIFCENNRLNNDVKFLGKLNRLQVRKNLLQADAFVLPSRFEAFGVVFIEAMACGLPVIATMAGGPESFIIEQTGMVVKPENPEALAEAIISVRDNYEKYPGNKIRDYAVNNFSRQRIAERYIELYHSIIEKK